MQSPCPWVPLFTRTKNATPARVNRRGVDDQLVQAEAKSVITKQHSLATYPLPQVRIKKATEQMAVSSVALAQTRIGLAQKCYRHRDAG